MRAHQEARQSADLRHDIAKRTLPSDGPYKPGDKDFVWSAPVNAKMIAFKSKAWKKERWIRGTIISQEGSMVNVHVDNAVMRVNQSKIRRDHDEWHDVAVPGLDNPDPAPQHRNPSRNQETEHHFLRKERRKKKGDKHRHQSRNDHEPGNHGGAERHSGEKKKERRREIST